MKIKNKIKIRIRIRIGIENIKNCFFYLGKAAVPLPIYCLVYIAFFLVKRGSTSRWYCSFQQYAIGKAAHVVKVRKKAPSGAVATILAPEPLLVPPAPIIPIIIITLVLL